jgi:hypothetical protein
LQSFKPEKLAENAALFAKRRPLGCEEIVQLSTIDIGNMWFEVISQYDTIAEVLVVLSILRLEVLSHASGVEFYLLCARI